MQEKKKRVDVVEYFHQQAATAGKHPVLASLSGNTATLLTPTNIIGLYNLLVLLIMNIIMKKIKTMPVTIKNIDHDDHHDGKSCLKCLRGVQ